MEEEKEGRLGTRTFARVEDVPERVTTVGGDTIVVPDFELLETLVRRGADSRCIGVVADGADARWLDAATRRRGDEPVVPPRPYACTVPTLLVLPTYNERENLAPIVRQVERHLACDILVVDDNSPDGTGRLADELHKRREHLHVLHRPEKAGLGRAYRAAFAWALERGYERVIQMDCDFSHAPWDLPRLFHASMSDDVVIGSRYVPAGRLIGWSRRRRTLSRGANFYVRMFLGRRVRDWTAGFRCYRAELLTALDLAQVRSDGYAFQIEMTWRALRAGASVRELPVNFIDRSRGRSKMSRAIAFEAVRVVPWLRTQK